MRNLEKEVLKKINKPDDTELLFYVASYATCEVIEKDKTVSEVRS